jgi:hypothetical protein
MDSSTPEGQHQESKASRMNRNLVSGMGKDQGGKRLKLVLNLCARVSGIGFSFGDFCRWGNRMFINKKSNYSARQ